jgi:hypothetical protein
MPARDMHFTFDTKVKVNKSTVLQFVNEFEDVIRENFQEIKEAFNVKEINTDFLKQFIKEMKSFDNVSVHRGEVFGKQKVVKDFIYDIVGDEIKEPTTVLGVRYLYDEWDYEGAGRDDYYYLTFTDDVKMLKKTTKEAEKLVSKLRNLGAKVTFEVA